MENEYLSRTCMLQIVHARMLFKQLVQTMLKQNQTGVTFEMLQILSCLWKEQGISHQELAARTSKDKACLTSLMNNLEKKGYIYRKEDEKDRRSKLVYLTAEGEEFHRWILPKIEGVYSLLDKEVGVENLKKTISLLNKWCDVLEKL